MPAEQSNAAAETKPQEQQKDATNVAGREQKGTSLAEKLVPGKGGNKDVGAEGEGVNTTGIGNMGMNQKQSARD